MLGRTDGSWVRPDRREKEGVATQEVMVNWAACSSHLQVEKKKKKYLGRCVPTVSTAATLKRFPPKAQSKVESPKNNPGVFTETLKDNNGVVQGRPWDKRHP